MRKAMNGKRDYENEWLAEGLTAGCRAKVLACECVSLRPSSWTELRLLSQERALAALLRLIRSDRSSPAP